MIPIVELKYLLKNSVSAQTSVAPDKWSKDNPFYGHCAVITALVQDFLGGEICRGLLPKVWADKLGYRSHYWNVVPGLGIIDLSGDQFPADFPYVDFINGVVGDHSDKTDKREYLLSYSDTLKRYEIISKRVTDLLNSNPLFLDEKHQKCWELAFSGESKCPKMRFVCLVYDGNNLIANNANRLMTEQFGKERFCSLDGSRCKRLEITSRMDAVIGDCGHAPIWCLASVFELGIRPHELSEIDFYEAGFSADGSPWFRKEPDYSCTYCQNMFAIFGLDKIWVAFEEKWEKVYTRDSFYSSVEYALGEKKV